MDEDIIADTAADVKVEGPSSPPKENNTASTSLSSPPNTAAALSAPGNNASDGLNTSMHARTRTSASSPNASPDMDTADDFPVDPLLIHTLTFSIERKDYQAAAAPNSAPETLKNFSTNKALIDAVNNAFLETYDAYTGKAKMTSFGDSKRLIIYFQTAEAHDACVGAAHQQGRTRDRNPVAALKERFNINQPTQSKACSRSGSHSRSRSKGPDNSRSSQPCQPLANISNASTPRHDRSKSGDRYDRSVSFSTALHTPPSFSSRSHSSTMPPHEAANILSLLKALQQDMADVRNRITALELNDQHMARIEQHLGLSSPLDTSNNS
ncbi:hypothetical protein GLOIN_2v1673942 [Rhizophagus clarus]|uniref:Uncharacterized protein n=1 Tax=Rhizophagus clarus TaxID=94130 RepID=A0A8H3QYX4_9GLOM|nr:hypothetical protein GLOIN_2v1673942 [Rhizophagus clarus]